MRVILNAVLSQWDDIECPEGVLLKILSAIAVYYNGYIGDIN